MKKKSPFTIVLDSHKYEGPLKLFTHTRLSIRTSDVTYVGLGKRGLGVRSAMAQQCHQNAKVLMEKDPNRRAEAQAAASEFFQKNKADLSQLWNHQPLYGIKEGTGTILRPDGQYVKLQIEDGTLVIDILCYKAYHSTTSKPETWVVVQVTDGRTFDVVARHEEPIKIAAIPMDGSSALAEIGVDQKFVAPQRPDNGKPFNGINGLPT